MPSNQNQKQPRKAKKKATTLAQARMQQPKQLCSTMKKGGK